MAAVALLSSAVAAFWLLDPKTPSSPAPLRVVQRLDRPVNVAPFDPVRLAATAERRWTALDIEREWTRFGSRGSEIYRSPEVAISTGGLFAIVATFPAGPSPGATLLWSTGRALTEADFARNRQELRARDATGAIVLRGDILPSGTDPIQHLFLHAPAGHELGRVISTLSVLQSADLVRDGAAGPLRATLQNEAREMMLARPGARVSFAIDASAPASLSFGVLVESPSPVTVGVRESVGGGSGSDLVVRELTPGAWHDFTVPLSGSGRRELNFEADAATASALIRWSLPLLLQPDGDRQRPNVVLYVVDALRADALSAYGSSGTQTPAIDRLAREGLVFEHAYAAASWTKPSVTTLLTSLYPMTHGLGARFYSDPFPSSAWTLQKALGAAGYATAQFSANPFTAAPSNLDRGFDVALMASGLSGGPSDTGGAAALHDRLLAWIAARRDQRFFAYVHPVDLHPPFAIAAATPREAYEASLASLDKEIAALRQRLAALGLERNTLFVLTADHGEAFGEHGREGHGQSVYDEEVRVPLILHWPGRLAPGRVAEPVQHVDLAPTILAAAGADAPGPIQGRSVWPAGGIVRPSPVIVTRLVYPEDIDSPLTDRSEMHAIVDYPWKLIRTQLDGGSTRIELYQLEVDPREREDRSAAEAERARTLSAALERLLGEQRAARARFAAEHAQPGAPAAREPSRELLDRLRSLGYVR